MSGVTPHQDRLFERLVKAFESIAKSAAQGAKALDKMVARTSPDRQPDPDPPTERTPEHGEHDG